MRRTPIGTSQSGTQGIGRESPGLAYSPGRVGSSRAKHGSPMIRAFFWDDYAAVVGLWRTVGTGVLPEGEVRGALQQGPDLFVVADDADAGIVGAVLGTFDGRRGWIHRLAVHPDHRRAGLATALVELGRVSRLM